MAEKKLFIGFLFLILFSIFSWNEARSQARGYELIPGPDLWYNDVDGIRIGMRLKGQVPGTFEDGPHRLDAGFWVGLWFPSLPVSYYLSFTEPIPGWSEYGSEANVQLISSVRTGYHLHGLGLNKRWQRGFDERRYAETGIFISFEKRFDDEYAAFPALWSDRNKLLSHTSFELQNDNPLGWYNLRAEGALQYLEDFFGTMTVTATQLIPFNRFWGFQFRSFAGITSTDTAPEYLFSRSSAPSVKWMQSGLTRAKGTIPQPWITSGNFGVAGGANLRGYTSRDVASFMDEVDGGPNPFLLNSIVSLNAEFDYLNPVAILFDRVPYASDFLSFRSYLFFDAGTSLGIGDDTADTVFADAGAGFSLSLNIPDYHGKPRGFVFRYEIPFWLSEPGTEDAFKYRHLFAIGAVISF